MKNKPGKLNSRTRCGQRTLCAAALALLAVGGAPLAHAAEAETDVMGPGNIQLEFKLGLSRDVASGVRQLSPPFLARIGLTDTLELRLGSDVRISSQADGVTTQGWADTSVALRYRLQELDDKTNTAGMALQLEQGLPTGSAAFRADGGSTALKFAYERALPDDMSIGVMPGVVRQRNADGAWFVAPSLAITLGKNWTPVFRTTAEIVAPQITSTANGGNVATANLGATYRLTEMFELEVGYARGLTKNTPDHSAVVGLNIKL